MAGRGHMKNHAISGQIMPNRAKSGQTLPTGPALPA
jgi:hypothetical protein